MHCEQCRVIIFISFALLPRGIYQKTVLRGKIPFNNQASNASFDYHETDASNSFTINTSGCTIPALDYSDPPITRLVQYPTEMSKCPHSTHPLLGNNQTHIWVIKKNLRHFHWTTDKLLCCYSGIELISSGNSVTYKTCITFNNIIAAMDEFVKVTCNVPYEKFFTFAPKNIYTQYRYNSYNVLIMGMRSVSRLNLHRTMPKTLSFMKSKKAIDMMGYNEVSENGILMHVLAMLLGKNKKELKKACWPSPVSTLDKCQFIWERFKDVGYYTALMEDSAKLSVFNLNDEGYYGFKAKPTDSYLHPVIKEAEKSKNKSQECIGNKYSYQVILDYIENLSNSLKSHKLFGVFWESSIFRQHFNQPMLMDHHYETFIKNLDKSGYLNETILILMSDQGVKFGDIYKTKQGQLANRLPFLNILLPPSFGSKFSIAYENLKANSRRLSTPYDVYNTLIDLIDLNVLKNEEVLLRSSITHPHDNSFSLFLPIPAERTCVSANISNSLCTCFESRMIEKNSHQARGATNYLIKYLNDMLRPYPQCTQLKVDVTLQAIELMVSYHKTQAWQDVTTTVRVSPGGGVFEATVRHYKHGGWSMGSIRRLNPQRDQGFCIHHTRLKMYCHCMLFEHH